MSQENPVPGQTAERRLLTHRALADASRVRLLEELQQAGRGLDASELAGRLGLHPNTVRSHLDVLERAGMVAGGPERRATAGRPRIVYEPVAGASGGETSGYRLLAGILASHLAGSSADPAAAAIEAGQAWGRYLVERPAPFARVSPEEAMNRVLDLLRELGFAPERARGEAEERILLHSCPFGELATTHPEVTCSVHLGLIRGALAELGAPVAAIRLEPFVKPSLCVTHLATAGVAGGASIDSN